MAKKKSTKKEALGLGIRALLSGIDSEAPVGKFDTDNDKPGSIGEISVDQIEVNPFQPRMDFDETALQELSDSIKIHGVVQPITVRKISPNEFQLIAGERRLRASKLAGLEKIPAYIRTADDQEMLEIALIENVQRQDLNPMEMAITYQRLKDECSLSDEEVGERLGKKRSTVTNFLRLLKLPPEIQKSLKNRSISMGHAKALVGKPIDIQLAVHTEIKEKDLSVRQVEALIRLMSHAQKAKKTKADLGFAYQQIQDKLSAQFESKVELKRDKQGRGQLSIIFTSDDDLNRILELLD